MERDPNVWRCLLNSRSPEVWVALVAGVAYVYRKGSGLPVYTRITEALISGMIAFSLGPTVAVWFDINEALGVVLLSSLGYLVLDVTASVISDRELIKSVIIKRLRGEGS